MANWMREERANSERQSQQRGRGSLLSVFAGIIESAAGDTQTAKISYPGGQRDIPLPMPFEATGSWIRSIPDTGSTALLTYRADTKDVTFLRYVQDRADKKLESYNEGVTLYRPLLPGEHEIHSSGSAQSFYSSRSVLEHRAGVLRSWLDQDRAEIGQKSTLHTRQMVDHFSDKIGDEERFGVVRRPKLLNPLQASVLSIEGSIKTISLVTKIRSSVVEEYPFPDFSLPGGAPALFSVSAAASSIASELLNIVRGEFKTRTFGREYLRVINNPIVFTDPITEVGLAFPPKLIDFREGQVFDDFGLQQINLKTGAYLRARHQYFSPLSTELIPDATTHSVDELGNVSWDLALAAISGFSISAPLGGFSVTAGLPINMFTFTTMDYTSTLSASFTSLAADVNISSTLATTIDGKAGVNISTLAKYALDAKLGISTTTTLNSTHEAAINYDIKAGVKASVTAPIVDIGATPIEPAVLGTQYTAAFITFLSSIVAEPVSLTGNLGSPVPWNPLIITAINDLVSTLPTTISTSVKVSP